MKVGERREVPNRGIRATDRLERLEVGEWREIDNLRIGAINLLERLKVGERREVPNRGEWPAAGFVDGQLS
jgi:hypothetical protein